VQLDREHVVGLVSEEGTRTAHAAILAHSLGIPAVMGASGALATIPNGAMLLLDGQSGIVVLDPTRDELEEAKTQLSRRHKLELQLEGVVDQPAVTPGRPPDPAHGQRRPARGDRAGPSAGSAGR
jgi:phosphotransferase system enzyme I (PtsI)